MLPYQIISMGTYTNPASVIPVNIALTDMPNLFMVSNRTNWGDTTAITSLISKWVTGMANGAYLSVDQTVTTNVLASNVGTSNGFTFVDPSNPPAYTALPATAINDTTWVVSMASTAGLFVGDTVRIYGSTGMHEIAGYSFQITAVTANTSITLGMMASSGITAGANATAAQVLKFIPDHNYPRWRYIANITQAAQATVYFTAANDFTPGEIVSFRVSSAFGMKQINNVPARVLSVTNTSTTSSIVIDLNTSGFTAFALPTSAQADAGISPAVCVPSSSGVVPYNGNALIPQSPPGTNLLDAFDNRNRYFMQLGTSVVGPASAVMDWIAIKADLYSTSTLTI